jgi:hypothetical protein
LLKAAFPEFQPGRLRTVCHSDTIEIGQADANWRRHTGQNQFELFTSIWGRVFPSSDEPPAGAVHVVEEHTNRMWTVPLFVLVTDAVPLFLPVPPNGSIGITIKGCDRSPMNLHLFLEGWVHLY